jgi:hypothetical protein
MIPDLTAWAESLGLKAVVVPLVLAGLFTVFLMFVQSIARLFDDQRP